MLKAKIVVFSLSHVTTLCGSASSFCSMLSFLDSDFLMLWLCHLQTLCFNSMLAIPTTENQREILTWAWHCHTTHTIHSGKLMTAFCLNARELWDAVCMSTRRRSGSRNHLASPWPSHDRLLFKCHLSFYLAKIGQDTSSSWQLSKISCVLQSDWLTRSLTWSI